MTNKITEFLDNAARHYYNGEPIISDEQFDRLADSVGYNKVGSKQHENVEKHYNRMWSLQKYYEDEKRLKPLESERDISSTIKLDGAALSLLYVNGSLVRALTRGDGIEGQIVTDKFLATNLVPHTISNTGVVQVIGEVAAPKHVENSRNYAAGALNLKDPNEFKTRSVQFFSYGVYPYQTETFDGDMQYLTQLGFNTVNDKNLDEVYPSDGLVFRVNSNKRFEELGFTAKNPKGSYALKERQEAVETVLLDVEWNTAKTGRVTPVAILEPIMIGDKKVTRATLNNPGFIEALGIQIGDVLQVRLSGMIIPEVLGKVEP